LIDRLSLKALATNQNAIITITSFAFSSKAKVEARVGA